MDKQNILIVMAPAAPGRNGKDNLSHAEKNEDFSCFSPLKNEICSVLLSKLH